MFTWSRAVGCCCVCGGGVYLFSVTFFFACMQCTYAVVHCYSVVGHNTHGWGAGVPCLIAELRVYLRWASRARGHAEFLLRALPVKGGRGRLSDISFFMCTIYPYVGWGGGILFLYDISCLICLGGLSFPQSFHPSY